MSTTLLLAQLLLASPPSSLPAEPLEFREFFAPSPRALRPSARLLGLIGKRVRMVGYMAQMEEPPKGGFYRCPAPVQAAEGGGGTADLPPDAVFVVVKAAAGKPLAHIPRPLLVTGVLEVGPKADEEGHVSTIRIRLDGPDWLPAPLPESPKK